MQHLASVEAAFAVNASPSRWIATSAALVRFPVQLRKGPTSLHLMPLKSYPSKEIGVSSAPALAIARRRPEISREPRWV